MSGLDVCFVNMPYATLLRPSLALGLLQAILKRNGFRARSVYGNLLIVDYVGLEEHDFVCRSNVVDALGDWTFSHLAFPDFAPDDAAYLKGIYAGLSERHRTGVEMFAERMATFRGNAARFLDDITERVLSTNPRIVGCSSTFQQHVPSLALLARIRAQAPGVVTMMGGANCETVMGRATHERFPWVDYVVSGEADDLIAGLVRGILEGGRDLPAGEMPEGVFGPAHRDAGYPSASAGCAGAGGLPRATARSIRHHPVPAFDDYFTTLREVDELKDRVTPAVAVETSRGCWWGRCTFCGLNGDNTGYRTKPTGQALREFETLADTYRVDRFETVDNVAPPHILRELPARLAERGHDFHVFFETRADLRRDDLRVLREGGAAWIQPGVESLHQGVLDLMDMGTTVWENVQLLKWAFNYGVRLSWRLLCGFPGEKQEWYHEMASDLLPLITHLQPPQMVMTLIRFDRFGAYHGDPDRYGLKMVPLDVYRYVYPLDDEAMADLVYFFEDEERQFLRRNPVLSALIEGPREGWLAARRAVKKWYLDFWLHDRAGLSVSMNGDTCRIRDTRPVACAETYDLDAAGTAVYLACDEAKTMQELHDTFAGSEDIRVILERRIREFLDRKLMVRLGERFLSLAVIEPVIAQPEDPGFPGGAIVKTTADARQRVCVGA